MAVHFSVPHERNELYSYIVDEIVGRVYFLAKSYEARDVFYKKPNIATSKTELNVI